MAITVRKLSKKSENLIKRIKNEKSIKTVTGVIDFVLSDYERLEKELKKNEGEKEKLYQKNKQYDFKLELLKESFNNIKKVLK